MQLRAILDSTLQGNGLMVLIAGEPGIGKTTLVEHFLDELVIARRGLRHRPRSYVRSGSPALKHFFLFWKHSRT